MTSRTRVKFAYYLEEWSPQDGDRSFLRTTGKPVVAVDVTAEMGGHLFCPECCTHLSKSPKLGQRFTNNRNACLVHWPSYKNVPCSLRSTKPEGLRFDSEEEAAKALDRKDLVLVNQFMAHRPERPGDGGVYDQTPVEDADGPLSDVPIARHKGRSFRLPTRISSVEMLCRRFDENIHRYYQLPGQATPQPLHDLLLPVTEIEGEVDVPRLYFGKIQASFVNSNNPQPGHIRMTKLVAGRGVADFYIKQNNAEQESKGIDERAVGRYVLFWSPITASGIGYCAERLGWGEYALLPDRYDRILEQDSQ